MSELVDKLKPHVVTIARLAKRGDNAARQIIDLYELHRAAPRDPGAYGLCMAALDQWLKKKAT